MKELLAVDIPFMLAFILTLAGIVYFAWGEGKRKLKLATIFPWEAEKRLVGTSSEPSVELWLAVHQQ